MPMVTENSAAQLGRALGSGTPVAPPPGPKRWPAWYFSLADALSAARAPVLAASAYFAVVALPDQSAEAARMMLDWHWFSLIVGVVLWGAFSAYLAITLAAMASRAFRIDSKARALAAPVVQKFLMLVLLAAPFLAGFFALGGHHIIGSVVSPLLERETWTELLSQVATERVLRQEAPVSMARASFAFILDSNVSVFLYSLVEAAFRGFAILMLAIYFGLPTIVIAFVLLYGALAGLANALAWILSRLGIRARRLDPAWPVVEVFDHHFLDLHGEKLEGVAVTIGVLFLIWTIGWGVAEYLFGIYVEIPTLFFLPIWATALCAALIGLVWLSARWHVPVLVPCLVFASLWSCADISDNHDIRHRLVPQLAQAALPIPGGDGARPPGRAQVDADPRRPLTDTFRLWLDQRADMARWHQAGRPFPVLLVAAEGGGARAAYFTALVMEELRARCPRLLHHTFLMVGVSGGSLGSALVAASAQAAPPAPGPGCEPPGAAPAEARGAAADAARVLEADLLSPLVRGTLVSDLLARLIPWDWPYIFGDGWLRRSWNWAVREPFTDITDRSRYLERAVDRAWRDRTGRALEQLSFEGVWEGTRGDVPALMLLTTDVATGRRVAVSHVTMPGRADAPVSGCAELPGFDQPVAEIARMRTLAEDVPGIDMPLSTAALLSARFTLLSPAGTLPCPGPRRRLVDGGYFENSGLTTMLDVIDSLRDIARERRVALVMLRIENSRATTNPSNVAGAAPELPPGSLVELASPVRALMATRSARAEQARAAAQRVVQLSRQACAAATAALPCVEIREVAFALSPGCVPIPLGWSLSDEARRDMQNQLLGKPDSGRRVCVSRGAPGRAQNRLALDMVQRLLAPP
ncbi:hypothetical protein [Plastoroseomonas hellenica]|uniref:hypothetical protein n=1 Tax=Plastoroseomonas hellenica TaxID=2687306 RepID=UPI001BAAFE5B|nr:hypothetical protein [Plastoroseomonas hellenica]MBR0647713.1 hypothetical protein [Plastoroseomonas hellenica]